MTARKAAAVACFILLGVTGYLYWAASPSMPTQSRTQLQEKGPAGSRPGGNRSGDAVPILAAAARRADVPVYVGAIGTVKTFNTVTVLPQVDGKLIKVFFAEGQEVPKGFVLAKIDPAVYQAQYDEAVAKKAQDEAALANARLDLDRYIKLAATNAVQKQQVDTQKSLVDQLTAQVAQRASAAAGP
jgi:membrane fusion protein, multidrug efflux system